MAKSASARPTPPVWRGSGCLGAALGLLLAVFAALSVMGETALPTLILAAPLCLPAMALGQGGGFALLVGWVGMPILYQLYFALLAWGWGMRGRAPMPWLLLLHDVAAWIGFRLVDDWPKYPGQIESCWMAVGVLVCLHALALLSAYLGPGGRLPGRAKSTLDEWADDLG
jgi:hypothetical protein